MSAGRTCAPRGAAVKPGRTPILPGLRLSAADTEKLLTLRLLECRARADHKSRSVSTPVPRDSAAGPGPCGGVGCVRPGGPDGWCEVCRPASLVAVAVRWCSVCAAAAGRWRAALPGLWECLAHAATSLPPGVGGGAPTDLDTPEGISSKTDLSTDRGASGGRRAPRCPGPTGRLSGGRRG